MRLDLRPYLSRGAEIRAHSPLAEEVQEPCFDDACDSLGTAGFRKAVRGAVDLELALDAGTGRLARVVLRPAS